MNGKQKNSKPKYMPVVKQDECRIYRNGVISHRGCNRLVNINGLSGYTRQKGDISTFSTKSRRRLREFSVKYEVPDAFPIGLTLTLPKNGDFEFAPEPDFIGPLRPLLGSGKKSDFAETIHRFGKNVKKAFPRSGCVWRAELQKRGAPHLHCVLWIRGRESDYFDRFSPESFPRYNPQALARFSALPLQSIIVDCWVKAVFDTCFVGDAESLREFYEGYGQCVEPLLNRSRYLRYCCDHLSKHKQEQLGYKGRQWGVFGRTHFKEIPPLVVEDSRARFRLWRVLGKIRRPKEKKSDCVFGCRRRKYHSADRGTTICGEETLRRLCDWLAISPSSVVKADERSEKAADGESKNPLLQIGVPEDDQGGKLPELASSMEANLSRFLWDDLSMSFAAGCRRMAGSPFLRENGRRTGAATATLS